MESNDLISHFVIRIKNLNNIPNKSSIVNHTIKINKAILIYLLHPDIIPMKHQTLSRILEEQERQLSVKLNKINGKRSGKNIIP